MKNKNLAEIIKEIENSKDKSEKKQKWKRIIQNPKKHAILSARIGTCEWVLKMLKPLEAKLLKYYTQPAHMKPKTRLELIEEILGK